MKIVLFEVAETYNAARLKYRSGEPLTIQEMKILRNYMDELIANNLRAQPEHQEGKR